MKKCISDERECILGLVNDVTNNIENLDRTMSLLYNFRLTDMDAPDQELVETTHDALFLLSGLIDRMRAEINNNV